MTKSEENVKKLIDAASEAKRSHEALHWSQAALNAANAARVLLDIEKSR